MLLESRVGGRVAENVFEDSGSIFFSNFLFKQKSKNLNEFQQDKHEMQKHTKAYHNPTT